MARTYNMDTNTWEEKAAKSKPTPASNTRKKMAAAAAAKPAPKAVSKPKAASKSPPIPATRSKPPVPVAKPASVIQKQTSASLKKLAETPATKASVMPSPKKGGYTNADRIRPPDPSIKKKTKVKIGGSF